MVQQLAVTVVLIIGFFPLAVAQTNQTGASLKHISLEAFAYFQQVKGQQFDEYLSRIRPDALAPELRTRVLNMLPKDDLKDPSPEELAKLQMLAGILRYHQRESVIQLKVLRATPATAVFVAGAAVLITETALKLLSAEELQAVVAHELGHEYFWSQFELARQRHNYEEIQQLELRCDGIAVVTLHHVGVDPDRLVSAIRKLDRYNQQSEAASQNYVAQNERLTFIKLMAELVAGSESLPPSGL